MSVSGKKKRKKKRRLLHSSEIKALYRAEKAILLSLLRSSSAASCHSLGAFLSMISIYRTQEVLHRLREVSQHQVPAPSRTKSLNCHKITCCPHDYSHYCLHEQEASVREGCWVHVYQAASKPFNWSDDRWKGIKSGVDYSGWSTKLNSGGGRRKTRRRNDVSSLNDVSEFCSCYSLHATKNKPYSRVGGKKSISYCCEAPLNTNNACKAQSTGGERQRARGMDECSWHCEGDGRRGGDDIAEKREGGQCAEEKRMIQARGNQICWKHVCMSGTFPLRLHRHDVQCYQTCFDIGASRLVLR